MRQSLKQFALTVVTAATVAGSAAGAAAESVAALPPAAPAPTASMFEAPTAYQSLLTARLAEAEASLAALPAGAVEERRDLLSLQAWLHTELARVAATVN